MSARATALAALLAAAGCREPARPPLLPPPPAPQLPAQPPEEPPAGRVVLDGQSLAARWVDGDTFKVREGPLVGRSYRLLGVNALESWGPVHRWGEWRPEELLELAREATRLVRSRPWACHTAPGGGGYGRELAACPEAARALVASGLAMVFAVAAVPDPELLAAQREAQQRGAGMWRKGAPPHIPTSLHSADEPDLSSEPYDRVVDTRTGRAEARHHWRDYATCEEVCTGRGPEAACMTYVPFERRYRNRPRCLWQR